MATMPPKHTKTTDMAHIALFSVVLTVCAWISIPAMVPFTLQTFGVFLAVGLLGGRRGSLAVLTYLLLGAVGIPVFSGFAGGVGCMLGSTGGYSIGFLLAALFMWGMERLLGRRQWVFALSILAGLLVCYSFGTAWFVWVYARRTGKIGIWTALGCCVFPYLIPDLLKGLGAMFLSQKLAGLVKSDRS